jgi:hypothetical protein
MAESTVNGPYLTKAPVCYYIYHITPLGDVRKAVVPIIYCPLWWKYDQLQLVPLGGSTGPGCDARIRRESGAYVTQMLRAKFAYTMCAM